MEISYVITCETQKHPRWILSITLVVLFTQHVLRVRVRVLM